MLPFDKMPYTNFHELNLAYFIVHFREIFAEWETLYNNMVEWREQTNQSLELWKTDTLNAIEDYERDLTDAWDTWKSETALDITDWKNETLDALDAWKTAFQTLFDSTFSNLSQIKTDAEAARDAAIAAQDRAEAAATGIAGSLDQIATNTNDVASLKTQVSKLEELKKLDIDETTFISGYLNTSGVLRSGESYITSPFLRCAFGKIEGNALTSGDTICSIAFYSSPTESSFISGYINTNPLNTFPKYELDVPVNCNYIRICKNVNSAYVGGITPYIHNIEKDEAMLERIDTIDDTANEALEKINNLNVRHLLSEIYRTVVDDRNLVDTSAYSLHCYVDNDGIIHTTTNPSSSAYPLCLSAYIPVIAGKVIYLSAPFFATGQYFAFYDSEKRYLGGKNEYGIWYTRLGICSKTVPANAAYLRVTSYTEEDAQKLWASYTGATPTGEVVNASISEYIDYHYFPTNPCDYNGNEICVFNKIACIGDSITSGYFNAATDSQSIPKYSYPAHLKKITGVETANFGVAGSTSVSWWSAHSADDFSGFDCAIINFGINDALEQIPETDTRSAFASIITALKTANTGIKIFIANVNPAYARRKTDFDNINAVLADIATNTADCYLVNLTQYGHTVGVANADGHLTAVGYLHLALDYKAAIGWIIKNNPTEFRYVQFIGTNLQPQT